MEFKVFDVVSFFEEYTPLPAPQVRFHTWESLKKMSTERANRLFEKIFGVPYFNCYAERFEMLSGINHWMQRQMVRLLEALSGHTLVPGAGFIEFWNNDQEALNQYFRRGAGLKLNPEKAEKVLRPSKKIDWYTAETIRILRKKGHGYTELAQMFDLHRIEVHRVVNKPHLYSF